MQLPEWINEEGIPFRFTAVNTRQFRGMRLAGTILSRAVSKGAEISMQEWEWSLYHTGCRFLQFFQNIGIQVNERKKGLRLEAVLTGELNTISEAGNRTRLRAGEYHITDAVRYLVQYKKDPACQYFVTYFPDQLINDFAVGDTITTSSPRRIPEAMMDLIQEALHNPYEEKLRSFYYQNLVRELFFIHLTTTIAKLPAELTADDIAAVYEADAILATDLSEHYTIPELSSMAGTNAFKLKRGFRLIFKMGVFGRLLYRRMEQAKVLLATTSKPIKEVAIEAGYETVAGFITAFGKRFGMTPLEWRENKSGNVHQSEAI